MSGLFQSTGTLFRGEQAYLEIEDEVAALEVEHHRVAEDDRVLAAG